MASLLPPIDVLLPTNPPSLILLVTIGLLAIYTAHYLVTAVKKPTLHGGGHRWSDFIRSHCPALAESYWPPIWCYHSHLLTALSALFRKRLRDLPFHRELIRTPDGGQIALDWHDPEGKGADLHSSQRPIVIFIPALLTHSRAEYFRILIPTCHELGYRAVVLNYRGLGGTELLNGRVSGITDFEDVQTALEHIRSRHASARVVGVGISLGGIILAGYLASAGEKSLIDAAFLVSLCWNLGEGSRQLECGLLNRRINRMFTQLLIAKFFRHRVFEIPEHQFDLEAVRRCVSLREFDQLVTIKMYNYSTVEQFYEAASIAGRIADIRVPTLCINSADDAIAPRKDLPITEVTKSDCVALLVTARGGHYGFMEGGLVPSLAPSFYMERLFKQYMSALNRLSHNPRDMI